MDPLNIIIMVLIMFVLLLLAGWFAGSETALTNLSPGSLARIQEKGGKGSKHLRLVKKDMDRNLVTILVLNNVVNIVLSSIAALFANALFDTVGVSLIIGLMTFLIIVFGEIVPKSIAMIDTERISKGHSKPLYYLTKLFTPMVILLVFISRIMIKLRGRKPRKTGVLVSDQDIKDLVILGEKEGTIKSIEREIIHKVFNFGDSRVKEVMVPMKDVFMIKKDIPLEKGKEILSSKGYTRVPFMGKNGKIRGIIYSKDLLGKSEGDISHHARKIFTLRSDQELTIAFGEMKRNRTHMAIVVGNNGEHVGIITMEDMIEEIVGDIYDEYFIEKGIKGPISTKGQVSSS